MGLPTSTLRPLINAAAFTADLPWWRTFSPGEWLEALILQESGGNPRATRYEAHQDGAGRKDAAEDADKPGLDDGELEDDKSYGLMQVMGYNARRIVGAPAGTPLNFGFLLRPIIAIAFGVRILADELKATNNDVRRALARYNGGPTGDHLVAGQSGQLELRRQEYVDGVLAWAHRVHGDRGGAL